MKIALVIALLALFPTFAVFADPPNTILMDGRPTEYGGIDLRGVYTGGGGSFGAGNVITNLFVTWDAEYLYIALQGWEADNKLVVMLDVDPGNGTGATTTTNWSGVEPGYIQYNDVGWRAAGDELAPEFGLDYMIASEGYYNDLLRIAYDGVAEPDTNTVEALFSAGNGSTPRGAPVDMATYADGSACDLQGFEARIAWSELYNVELNRFGEVLDGEVVPRGAMLRLFANIHNNNPASAYSASDSIPRQTSPLASHSDGLLTTADYIDVVVDADNDGLPDIAAVDVNAPFIRFLAAAAGQRSIYAMFNEPVIESTATNIENWLVDGIQPQSIAVIDGAALLIAAAADLPGTGVLVRVSASGVEDAWGNSKHTYGCLLPTSDGIQTAVTVRFLLETASGLGADPGATNFYINGGSMPLEWGYPPSTMSPLSQFNGSLYYRDVTFPPGSPSKLHYKYSGMITGTNTYEAIRLHDFSSAARELTLNPQGATMVVTDYLGAAAGPYRDAADTNSASSLYLDARRGDAGVRNRTTLLFQLDLSGHHLAGISRVLVQGSDPLRGFNVNSQGISDYANPPAIGWDAAGITLYDDGSNGDLIAGDAVYSRLWSCTTNGIDTSLVPAPGALVGGTYTTMPYGGLGWSNRRSPRSFAYKFYVYRSGGEALESPSHNLEYYIQASETNVVLPVFEWDNPALPPPPPSNSPTLVDISFTPGVLTVVHTNDQGESQHGLEISTNLASGWLDFGHRAILTGGVWQTSIRGVTGQESYRTYAGPPRPAKHTWWTPNPIPSTGAIVRFHYNQNQRLLAGCRDVNWFGANPWEAAAPFLLHPMEFDGHGQWHIDLPVTSNSNGGVQFLFTDSQPSIYDKNGGGSGNDYWAQIGGRATWAPDPVAPGDTLSLVYQSTGGLLDGSTNINAHVGFDGWEGADWQDVSSMPMTETTPGVWTLDIVVPTNRRMTVNFVFNNGDAWDNNSNRNWNAFIGEPE